jgi:hypothetical protein
MRIIAPAIDGNRPDEILLGSRDIPAAAIRANLIETLKEIKVILTGVNQELGNCRVAHVDVTVGVGLDGSVGLLGVTAKASASGGLTMRIVFDET